MYRMYHNGSYNNMAFFPCPFNVYFYSDEIIGKRLEAHSLTIFFFFEKLIFIFEKHTH